MVSCSITNIEYVVIVMTGTLFIITSREKNIIVRKMYNIGLIYSSNNIFTERVK